MFLRLPATICRRRLLPLSSFGSGFSLKRYKSGGFTLCRFVSTTITKAMNMTNNVTTRLSSHGTGMLNDVGDEDEEEDCDLRHHDSLVVDRLNKYYVAIQDGGQTISITEPRHKLDGGGGDNDEVASSATANISWEFSSTLLWVNDPQYIHPSSGQRVRTLGQYSRNFAVVRAQVVCIDDDGVDNDDDDDDDANPRLPSFHPVPPRGSLHSRGGIYYYSSDKSHGDDKNNYDDNDRTLVKLKWNYGEESIFDLEWLIEHARNNCLGRMSKKNSNRVIENCSRDGDDIEASSRKRLERTTTTTSTTTAVNKDIAIGAIDNANSTYIATFDYRNIMQNEDILFEGMQDIFEHGAILIRNAPDVTIAGDENDGNNLQEEEWFEGTTITKTTLAESIVGNLGKRLSGGSLSHGSLYGDVFHVQTKSDAENIAYTNVALPPHQDLTYYESKPFLQLLHCVTDTNNNSNSNNNDGAAGYEDGTSNTPTGRIDGGESVLIDAMAAAEELRRIAPDLFETLCKTEATFVKERHDADMVSPKPHIVVDPTYGQVVEVNWSPPFEGPLQIHPQIAVEDYVRAYQAMESMLDDKCINDNSYSSDEGNSIFLPKSLETLLRDYAKQYTWECALQKGDILVFNNQRMLHGRRSFSSFGNVKRQLIGCYTDSMDTVSRYRQLLRERKGKGGGGYGRRNPGSGCRWM